MAWRAVHPSLTEVRRIPVEEPDAPTFTLGFWPPLEAEKAKIYISKVRRQNTGGTLPEELQRRAAIDLEAFWAMARFGVRFWSGLGELPCKTENVTLDGREHIVLTDESLQILYHSGLLLPVALECWRFNSLTEEEKKNVQFAVELHYLDERHACQRCDDKLGPGDERGGILRLDGRPVTGCPYDLIPEATWSIVAAYNDWDKGHTPVTTGRAPWLPIAFTDGVQAVDATIKRMNAATRARATRIRRLDDLSHR